MDIESPIVRLLIDVKVLPIIMVNRGLLKSNMAKAIPLGAALGVEGQDIIMCTDVESCVFIALLEVDDVVFEKLSAGRKMVEII